MTRADLSEGTQACQIAHVALDFAVAHPDVLTEWHNSSNTLVVLATPDELDLVRLYADAVAAGLCAAAFHEPDLGSALTAVALESRAHRLVSHLPLALAHGEEVRT